MTKIAQDIADARKVDDFFEGGSHVDVYPNPLYKTTTAMPRIDIPPGMKNVIYLREMPPPWRLPECDGSTYSSSTKPGGYIFVFERRL